MPWNATPAAAVAAHLLLLSADGNNVAYDRQTPYWASQTQRTRRLPLRLCVQADGNLVAYESTNVAFWASKTCCQGRPTPMTALMQVGGLPSRLGGLPRNADAQAASRALSGPYEA
jgi:hypothetical protein